MDLVACRLPCVPFARQGLESPIAGEVATGVARGAAARGEGLPPARAVERAVDGDVEGAWSAVAVAEELPHELCQRQVLLACDPGQQRAAELLEAQAAAAPGQHLAVG